MPTSDWVTAIASIVAALAAVSGVFVAWWQLGNLIDTLKMNALAVVLQLESEMNARKEKVDSVSADIRKECIRTPPDQKLVDILTDQLKWTPRFGPVHVC